MWMISLHRSRFIDLSAEWAKRLFDSGDCSQTLKTAVNNFADALTELAFSIAISLDVATPSSKAFRFSYGNDQVIVRDCSWNNWCPRPSKSEMSNERNAPVQRRRIITMNAAARTQRTPQMTKNEINLLWLCWCGLYEARMRKQVHRRRICETADLFFRILPRYLGTSAVIIFIIYVNCWIGHPRSHNCHRFAIRLDDLRLKIEKQKNSHHFFKLKEKKNREKK